MLLHASRLNNLLIQQVGLTQSIPDQHFKANSSKQRQLIFIKVFSYLITAASNHITITIPIISTAVGFKNGSTV